jgi:hypothetical protein
MQPQRGQTGSPSAFAAIPKPIAGRSRRVSRQVAAFIVAYMVGLGISGHYLSQASEAASAGDAVIKELTDEAHQAFWFGIAFAMVGAAILYGLLAAGYFTLRWILRGFRALELIYSVCKRHNPRRLGLTSVARSGERLPPP